MELVLEEHQILTGEQRDNINNLQLVYSEHPTGYEYLGLGQDFRASYFIGVDWLDVSRNATIQVFPKIRNLDFMSMFLECLHSSETVNELNKIYHISLSKPAIHCKSLPFDITPMLIVHFLAVVKNLVRKGLKRDYVRIEENLNSKFKGKLLFNTHLKKNLSKGRISSNYCIYQDYLQDCPENRFIKKTLRFVASYISKYYPKKEVYSVYNFCASAFEEVSDTVNVFDIKKLRINPVFKEYVEAIRLAKLILQKFGYSLAETKQQQAGWTPPFWIDMSLLFEVYVLGKLKAAYGKEIHYQAKGKYGNADFLKLDEKMVIDTKYKLLYGYDRYAIENIRQVAGYARDINIRKKLKADYKEMLPCCIIYPSEGSPSSFVARSLKEESIPEFIDFWKVGIQLPRVTV